MVPPRGSAVLALLVRSERGVLCSSPRPCLPMLKAVHRLGVISSSGCIMSTVHDVVTMCMAWAMSAQRYCAECPCVPGLLAISWLSLRSKYATFAHFHTSTAITAAGALLTDPSQNDPSKHLATPQAVSQTFSPTPHDPNEPTSPQPHRYSGKSPAAPAQAKKLSAHPHSEARIHQAGDYKTQQQEEERHVQFHVE